jgi:AcrR family transcriptional regulator
MSKAAPIRAGNTYHAHRERQRRRILDAARALFDDRGIDRVTMAELTSASGVQPSTVYQYFSNKDDIVWTLVGEVMEQGTHRAKLRLEGAHNALGEIAALFDYLVDDLSNNPVQVRFMAQFDAIYARNWPAERLLALESQVAPAGLGVLKDLVRKGIADGSLRPDLDPELTLHAILNTLIGAQRRLASLGSKVEVEYGNSVDRLFRETVRVILFGLRAQESPAGERTGQKTKAQKRNRGRRSS